MMLKKGTESCNENIQMVIFERGEVKVQYNEKWELYASTVTHEDFVGWEEMRKNIQNLEELL